MALRDWQSSASNLQSLVGRGVPIEYGLFGSDLPGVSIYLPQVGGVSNYWIWDLAVGVRIISRYYNNWTWFYLAFLNVTCIVCWGNFTRIIQIDLVKGYWMTWMWNFCNVRFDNVHQEHRTGSLDYTPGIILVLPCMQKIEIIIKLKHECKK